jgi:hypothetical protein|tara:strand:- start:1920 stop:2186 length:267 start_codon:yes stop_codon:yes gene_type:complete
MGFGYTNTRLVQNAFTKLRVDFINNLKDVQKQLLNELDAEAGKSLESRVESEFSNKMDDALRNKNGTIDKAVKQVEQMLTEAMDKHDA